MQYSSSTPSFNNNKNNGGSRNFTHSPENVRSQSYRSTVFYRDEDGTTHELSKGSWYTLPTGWSGRWDIEGKMRKLYILTK